MTRQPMTMVPVLFFAAFLWTAEAWGRADDKRIERKPQLSHLLKNFA